MLDIGAVLDNNDPTHTPLGPTAPVGKDGSVDRVLVARYAVRETLGLGVMAAALFWAAGTVDWWAAWAALGVMGAWTVATAVILITRSPGLLADRLGPGPGAKRWDVAIVSLLGLIQLLRYVVAGLDRRYGWSGHFPSAALLVSLAVCLLGYALVAWATAVNPFFSQVARIQPDRGHAVIATGPYRTVRHPAYAGALLYESAVCVLLESWPALALSSLNVVLLVIRTSLEDRMLRAELPGYQGYAERVRARLIPAIW